MIAILEPLHFDAGREEQRTRGHRYQQGKRCEIGSCVVNALRVVEVELVHHGHDLVRFELGRGVQHLVDRLDGRLSNGLDSRSRRRRHGEDWWRGCC